MAKIVIAIILLLLTSSLVEAATNTGSYVLQLDGPMHWIAVGTDENGYPLSLSCRKVEGIKPIIESAEDVVCVKPDGSYVPSSHITYHDPTAPTRTTAGRGDEMTASTPVLTKMGILGIGLGGAVCVVVGLVMLFCYRRLRGRKEMTGVLSPSGTESCTSSQPDSKGELEIVSMPPV